MAAIDVPARTGLRADDHLLRLFQLQARDRGLADLLVTTIETSDGQLEELRAQASTCTRALIARAQEAGELRPDFRHQDLPLPLMANAGLAHRTAAAAPDSWRRFAAFVLDGLRATAATPARRRPLLLDVGHAEMGGTTHPLRC